MENREWYKLLSREGVDVTTISQVDVTFYDLTWQAMKIKKGEFFFTSLKNKNFTHYIGTNPDEVARYTYKKYFNSPKQIVKYYEEGKVLLKNIKKDTLDWSKRLSNKSTNEEILSAYKIFRKSYEKVSYIYSITSWLGVEAWQTDFENVLNNLILKNNLEEQSELILSTVYKPWKKTALIEIQEKLAQGSSPKDLVKQYQFLRSWAVVWYKPITAGWIKGIQAPNQKKEIQKYSPEKLIKLLKPNAQEKKFIQIAPYLVFFKDWRDDVRRFHAYHWSFLFDLLGKRFKVNRDDVGYLTVDEIENTLRESILDKKIIASRKNGCIITIGKHGLSMMAFNNIPKKYKNIINSVEKKGLEKVVKGNTAYPGFIKGVVKIVRSYHDIKLVQDGDILVANTTHPNYLPAMKKAGAFITNEGGTISHSAIVARELKKPCVVGTKNATKILTDGDLVEVDANKGTIKIIKR